MALLFMKGEKYDNMTNSEYLKKLESYEKVPNWYSDVYDRYRNIWVKAPIMTAENGDVYIKLWGNTYFVEFDEENNRYFTNTKYWACRV